MNIHLRKFSNFIKVSACSNDTNINTFVFIYVIIITAQK